MDTHAFPSSRKLAPGDFLVIDWGASYEGYISDITRTFAIGEIAPEMQKIYQIVKEANEAGRAAGRPGIHACDVDKAARDVIKKAGYGKYFTHRVGHGLGMEAPIYRYTLLLQPLCNTHALCIAYCSGKLVVVRRLL